MTERSRVLVAMSGGVDSSVAAALLVEQGHDVIGATMKTFCYSETESHGRTCCGLEGILDARRVAERLGIPHYVFDMEASFADAVVRDFVDEYVAGRTPNPCVRCNSNTKIPDLLRRGRMLGADGIATGHFARIECDEENRTHVLRGRDREKDQAYFLWGVPGAVVDSLRFPVGALTKAEIRAYARRLGLRNADKPESQEICFVPTGDYTDLLRERLGSQHPALQPGPLVDTNGAVVGEHRGYGRYTVGQRKGLGGGRSRSLYVIAVQPERNEVVVGSPADLMRTEVRLCDLNWIGQPPRTGEEVGVQVRHRAPEVAAEVIAVSEGEATLRLAEPVRAVTPGQSGVVFRGERLVGGGRIR